MAKGTLNHRDRLLSYAPVGGSARKLWCCEIRRRSPSGAEACAGKSKEVESIGMVRMPTSGSWSVSRDAGPRGNVFCSHRPRLLISGWPWVS
jgi:hypothetical protein